MNKTTILFNPEKHIYTNTVGNEYISATTLIDKYENKFEDKKYKIARNCSKIGNNKNHRKYKKYSKLLSNGRRVALTTKEILNKWDKTSVDGRVRGNNIHDYLETKVKQSSGYYDIFTSKYETSDEIVKLYTLENILENPNSGNLDLNYFIQTGIKDKYPKIFNIIEAFVKDGWKIYSEVAVFNNNFLISGLIDIIFIKNKSFVILDWKTNKANIKFESGYWDKDINDNITNYIYNEDKFKYPLNHLDYSVGIKYTLQLSLYNWLAVQHGFKFIKNILCHVKHESYSIDDKDVIDNPDWLGKTKVDLLNIEYLDKDVNSMIMDYEGNRTKFQKNLFA